MYRISFLRVLLVLLVPIIGATAVTIHVPGDYSTIQGGLGGALTGDTVLVAPGTYIENLIWPNTQSIKLLSESGREYTIIDGNNLASVINISVSIDTSTVISGFTIRNGNGSEGGGINSVEGLSIIGNHITENYAFWGGGGINMGVAPSDYSDNENRQSISSGSEMTQGNRDPNANVIYGVISDCLISGNTSPCGGGILGQNFSGVITKCSIVGNDTDGIFLRDHFGTVSQSFLIDSTEIFNNTGDGIQLSKYFPPDTTATYAVHSCNIFSNTGYGITGIGPPPSQGFDATYNWWGDPSGPGGVGPGTGDEVCEYVFYDPWLTEVGVETAEQGSQMELCVFPNPFSSNATVSLELSNTGLVTIQVFDLSGRIVDESAQCLLQAGNQTIQLDGSKWSPGVYLIHLNTSSSTVTQRCVLVR